MRRTTVPHRGHGCGVRLTMRRHVDLLRVSSAGCTASR
ncbi:putative leader peptide [Tomitella fengzijianii]